MQASGPNVGVIGAGVGDNGDGPGDLRHDIPRHTPPPSPYHFDSTDAHPSHDHTTTHQVASR